MNLEEFSEFFHFFRSEIKLYHIGYNLRERNDLSDWNGEWAGATSKCAMQITILGNYWQYPLI